MGGINSVCLKPRSITNSAASARRPSSADNEANIVTTDLKRRTSEVVKTMETSIKNGDVFLVEEIKGEKNQEEEKEEETRIEPRVSSE